DRRDLTEAAQVRALADSARHRLAVAARLDQVFTLLYRARRDVVDEAVARGTRLGSIFIPRGRDGSGGGRLPSRVPALCNEAHGAGADIGLRHLGRFLYFDIALQRLDL